jgi:hypothetical protein
MTVMSATRITEQQQQTRRDHADNAALCFVCLLLCRWCHPCRSCMTGTRAAMAGRTGLSASNEQHTILWVCCAGQGSMLAAGRHSYSWQNRPLSIE